jgi:hypothetical protein
MTNGANANVIPAERSISPHTRRNTSPAATIAVAEVRSAMLPLLSLEVKAEFDAAKYTHSPMTTMTTLSSRSRSRLVSGENPDGGGVEPADPAGPAGLGAGDATVSSVVT